MDELKKYIEFLRLIGFDSLLTSGSKTQHTLSSSLPEKSKALQALKEEVLNCCRCRLCEGRKTVVFGEGNFETSLMLVGEAPGEQEDIQGRPFVGRAGQLLTRFMNIFGVPREKVFITNIVKCRPPGNRNPQPDEIQRCFPFLERQIGIVSPKVILCLGAFATRTLLKLPERASISKLRGNPREVSIKGKRVTIISTFHPAYLLRNKKGEPAFQRDLELALRLSGML